MNKLSDNPFADLPVTGWYPGHMLKAGRQIRQQLKLVDLVLELRDARIPQTSHNPDFNLLLGQKLRCIVLTKSDLADACSTRAWSKLLTQREQTSAFMFDNPSGRGSKRLLEFCHRIIEKNRRQNGARGKLLRPPRIMITGIPNVGKSTLINRLAAHKKTAVGPRPGVTRSQQWVRLRNGMELLDTPGVLWPRIEDKPAELKLALTGTIKDELIGEELLTEYLLWWNSRHDRPFSWRSYGLNDTAAEPTLDQLLAAVGKQRGLLASGGQIDYRRAAAAVLQDFRRGKLGRATLDQLPEHTA